MPKITIDNKSIECRDGITVLQAALDAGWDVPHYCYHPGLSIVASCRLCLMEMQMPHPKTQEMGWAPKLMPSCQTLARDGLIVRFDSQKVKQSQRDCMEFFLLNHPLDCPVCDQAGECYLQDYSYKFGDAESRMFDEKLKNPKKDIGPKTLLYQDRCVLCTRCVRFTEEISGTGELCVSNRGVRNEIDVFPGYPLDNALQGNVVDICPVGALLDKSFLFKKRVWELESARSICPGCATGCSIRVDHSDGVVYRLKPRYNPEVNHWWMCDEGRFGFDYVGDEKRIVKPTLRRGSECLTPEWNDIPAIIRFRFEDHVHEHGSEGVFAVLSPFMACEEAWLVSRFVREVAPQASLAVGPIPFDGEDRHFPTGSSAESAKFTIRREKCPNRRGIEKVLENAGGSVTTFEKIIEGSSEGLYKAGWIAGGYPTEWVNKDCAKLGTTLDLLVVQDIFDNALVAGATVVLPSCPWVEREGSFINSAGRIQPFSRATDVPDGCKRDGQYLFELAGYEGIYRAQRVRELMAATMPEFGEVNETAPKPLHAH